ncbi:MAG: glutamate synthase-related protein [Methyloprofundus sp.]
MLCLDLFHFALDASADYIILDDRGGGTGQQQKCSETMLVCRPFQHWHAHGASWMSKVLASGVLSLSPAAGLRLPIDIVKALALGADGIAISNSAIQAIDCVAVRMCNTNNCPTGIATQKEELRHRLDIEKSARLSDVKYSDYRE